MVPGRMMALIFDIILYMQLNLLEPMNVLKVRSLLWRCFARACPFLWPGSSDSKVF